MELKDVLAALRTGWWLALLGMLLGGGLAYGLSATATPTYTSTTQLFVSTTDSASTSDLTTGAQFSKQRVTSYAQLVDGPDLAQRVVDRLHLQLSPGAVTGEVVAAAIPDTVLIGVSVTDTSPLRAQAIAAAIGEEFPGYIQQLESVGGGPSPVRVSVTSPATLPTVPTTPQTRRNVVLGIAAGLVLGVGAAVLRRRLDRSVKTAEDAAHLAGAPFIGSIVRDEALARDHVLERNGSSQAAEAYRQLRTNLQFLNVDDPPRVILVSSALPGEGKSTLVINLAVTLSEADQQVVIVEADLRRPRVTRYLDLIGGVGLTNLLVGSAELDDVTQDYRGAFSVIAAGPVPPNPGELLASSHMAAVVEKLRGRFDYVLIDVPPLLPVADSSAMARHADGVVLSVRHGSTRKEQVREAAARLHRVGATVLGVVLNIVPARSGIVSSYGYDYDPDPPS